MVVSELLGTQAFSSLSSQFLLCEQVAQVRACRMEIVKCRGAAITMSGSSSVGMA